ncbi:hypothetical protein Pyrfu_0435 [Pyrolobus fumarii 1A]|uniref:DUF1640 domain-containing protein n=1 Tax=Pyrolobus fumarii (strain DSM 11204 / 1A) TaxID=694429 RepID=G0EG58_PYRF1|nr:hypothetical protein [Pyrolobus fumarii]AEM38306.1 hypothetical protein Pyrfu_0435 [Pyrolobus fumarii 1A]
MESLIDRLLEDAARHPEKRRRLARMLALDIATEETLRSLLLEGLLRDVATKQDLEKVRREMREMEERLKREMREVEERLQRQMEELRKGIWRLEDRMDNLVKWMVGLLASIWLTLVALLLPVVLKMLGLIG